MAKEAWTVRRAFNWTRDYLESKGDAQARLSTEWLLGAACNHSRIEVYTQFDKPLSQGERVQLRDMVRRRAEGEPLQYIVGETGFRHLTIKVQPGVLIPRPETEILVDLALAHIQKDDVRVLDLCTGTGCIGLAIAQECPGVQVVATDISPKAVHLANHNASLLDLSTRFIAYEADLFDHQLDVQLGLRREAGGSCCGEVVRADGSGLEAPVTEWSNNFDKDQGQPERVLDLIVANPPYIPHAQMDALPREVKDFEPSTALDGGTDGLAVATRIFQQAPDHLTPDGVLIMELDERNVTQAVDFAVQLKRYRNVDVHRDLTGRDRFVVAVLDS